MTIAADRRDQFGDRLRRRRTAQNPTEVRLGNVDWNMTLIDAGRDLPRLFGRLLEHAGGNAEPPTDLVAGHRGRCPGKAAEPRPGGREFQRSLRHRDDPRMTDVA